MTSGLAVSFVAGGRLAAAALASLAALSLGITVFSGMIASTCLAILFVPAFFVIVERFEDWLKLRGGAKGSTIAIPPQPSPGMSGR